MRLRPDFHASWEEADVKFEQFIASIPERREQLRELMTATGGPELDGTPGSLQLLNDWAITFGLSGQDDGMDWQAGWQHPRDDVEVHLKGFTPIPPMVDRLQELVAVYYADMCLAHDPTMQWVCWRGQHRIDFKNAHFVLDRGLKYSPCDPIAVANIRLANAIATSLYDPNLDHSPPDATRLHDSFTRWTDTHEIECGSEPQSWQAAPVGRKAHKRVPYRPTASAEHGARK